MSAGAASPTARSDTPFEHPAFEALYSRLLRDVADRRLEPATRKAAARALAFLLREQLVSERVITDVLTALHRSLDLSKVVRTLLLGLVGVSPSEKMTEWVCDVADRSLRAGHLPSFVSAMRILVDLPDYDGTVPTRWRLALLRAVEMPDVAPRILMLTRTYARRFPEESWWWLRTLRVRSTIASLRRRAKAADFAEAEEA